MMSTTYADFVKGRFKSGAATLGDGITPAAMERLHAAVGIIGELVELSDADSSENVIEELGDVLFYVQAFFNTHVTGGQDRGPDMPPQHVPSLSPAAIRNLLPIALSEAARLLDMCKKEVIYSRPEHPDMWPVVHSLCQVVFDLCCAFDYAPQFVIHCNIDKLEKRYPNGYSNAAAQERADKR